MASSSTSGTVGQLTKPEYRNWLALGHALTTELCQGLRPFVTREMETFYRNVSARVAGPCACVHVPRRRPNEYHDMSTCAWANILQAHHHKNKPNWKQSDGRKWVDPILGPWEIAKLFLPDLGGHADIKSAEDMDITGILNLMYWCNHFTIPQPLIKDVRDTRNDKWVHVPKLELTDADKRVAFDTIENLLQDPSILHDADAQQALRKIGNLKCVSDLQSMQARVLADFKEVLRNEISSINNNLTMLMEESVRNKEQQSQLKEQQEVLKTQLDELNWERLPVDRKIWSIVFGNLVGNIKGVRKIHLALWFMLLLLCRFCVILEDSYSRDGCSLQVYSDPWELKNFDFSDFINSSKAEFIGRQWLYQEMENVLEHTDKRGVLITGNPGSGKSAFLSYLLCSRTSSPLIHNRILGYHFCMHFDKGTQNGAKFVRNLANMIAWKMEKYRDIILTDSFVRRVLYKDCPQDTEWCFEQGILTPLKNVVQEPVKPWYIVVDALDECANEKAEILNMFKSKVPRLPKWLKLIVSSRNVSTITASFDGLQRVELRSDDTRNRDDIDTYLSLKVFPLKESIVRRVKTALAITDNEAPTLKIVSVLTERGQGNFQFVKVVLDLWLASTESVSWDTFPKTLDSSYQLYFERKYGTHESFQPLREIFEVLVAAYTPLTIHEMHSLLRLEHPALDLEYELMPKLDLVSLFLWHGSGDGLIRIHHASLSEWLTSENNKGKFYYVKKRNGHNRLARYYLTKAEENHSPLKPQEAFHLVSHIVEGGLKEYLVQQFLSLPSDHVNTTDPVTQLTALHHSSSWFDVAVTKLLVYHFSDVDCLDCDQRTPSFLAATSGHLKNLKTLFGRGANLNHRTTYLDIESASHSKDPIKECKRKLCGYSLLHTAAQEGNIDVVKFLIQHKANIFSRTGANNTAMQLAAANGHLETVQTLQRAGGELDDVSLHHAAAGGHNSVVQYLLREGIIDGCVHNTPSSMYPDEENSELKPAKVRLYDNLHLHLRETALHAAVGRGHVDAIKSLLSEGQNAINCPNSAARRPLHEAVYANNYNILEVLLTSGADANVQCDNRMPSLGIGYFTVGKIAPTRCPCGFTSLHIAAMHGYHSVAKLLIKYKADVDASDCNGSTPLHVASCHNMASLVTLLVNSGADINARSVNGSTPFHSAAACFAKDVFGPLIDLGCDHQATDDEGMTALHYVVKDITYVGFEYFLDLYVTNPKGWIEKHLENSQEKTMSELNLQYPWLYAFIKLVECFARTKRTGKTRTLLVEDYRNRSVFDILEEKTNTSVLLTGSNSLRGSLFVLSLTPVILSYDITISEITKNRVVALSKPYEQALIPRSLKRVLSRAYTSAFTKLNCSDLLDFVSLHLVYAANTLLQAGVDVNCRDTSGLTPLLVYLRTGGRHMSKVLVKHNVQVDITCGDPFENSVFHLASYHKLHYLHYLYEFLLGSNNWQKYLQTENAIFDYFLDRYDESNEKGNVEMIRTGDGPLALAILSHPNGSNVVDECYDADGYNALHRAAQGANVVAINKFLSWGANPIIETQEGFSPLWLSVLYAVKYRPFLNLERPSVLTALEVELASLSASTILNYLLRNGSLDIGCSEKRFDLTLYHIAATRGMWQFIAYLLSSKEIVGIDVDCPNKDGITPMYLAMFIGGDSCEWHSPWCKVVDVIKSYGGTLQYPTLEAEYFLIFNIFFGRNPSELFLELTEHEILTLQEGCGRDECREYKARNINIFETSDEVDRVHIDYQKKVDKCSSFIKDCPADIKTGLPHFTFVVFALDRQQAVKFSFLHIRNSFVTFLDDEIERLKKLLFTATRPHAEVPCEDVPEDYKPQEEKIDMCSQFHKQDLETVLHKWYRNYKESLDLVLENSDEVRSFMSVNGKLPRFLAKMNFALTNYDATLTCDWQAVAIKYVQLSFQVRNLNFWVHAAHETFTLPSVSGFLSKRMENVILQHSEESLKLVLKLASGQPTEAFNYLRILRFTKPPMWHETFYGVGNFG